MLDIRTLWGDVCSSTVCVTVYLSVCMVVCVQVYIFLVWECDSQNETSQQRRPGGAIDTARRCVWPQPSVLMFEEVV